MYAPGKPFKAPKPNAVSSVKTAPPTTSAAREALSSAISSIVPWISGASTVALWIVMEVLRMARTSESLCGLEVMKFRVVGRRVEGMVKWREVGASWKKEREWGRQESG